MDTKKLLLIAGGLFVGYKVLQTQRDISILTRQAGPFLANANGIASDVRGVTSSVQGISNAAFAVTNGLMQAFQLSNSGTRAPQSTLPMGTPTYGLGFLAGGDPAFFSGGDFA